LNWAEKGEKVWVVNGVVGDGVSWLGRNVADLSVVRSMEGEVRRKEKKENRRKRKREEKDTGRSGGRMRRAPA
jgi:hypothetical protein